MNAHRAGSVSPAERRAVARKAAQAERIGRVAVVAGRPVLRKLLIGILGSYQRGEPVTLAIRELLKPLAEIMRAAMLCAALRGMSAAWAISPKQQATADMAASVGLDPLTRAINFEKNRLRITPERLAAMDGRIDRLVIDIVDTVDADAREKVQSAMSRIISENLHTRGGMDVLREAIASAGLDPLQPWQLEGITRTQTMLAYSAGQAEVWRVPEVEQILWGFKYVTVGDDRVRPEHQLMDGTTLPKDDPFWKVNTPPCGWLCRCGIIEIFTERKTVPPGMAYDTPGGKRVEPLADKGFRFHPSELLS